MSSHGVGFFGAFVAALIGCTLSIGSCGTNISRDIKQLNTAVEELKSDVSRLKPVLKEEQVLDSMTPEVFYQVGEDRLYKSIDGMSVEEYFAKVKGGE